MVIFTKIMLLVGVLVLACIGMAILDDHLQHGDNGWLSKNIRYYKYLYWVHIKSYSWKVMHEQGGAYDTPLMNRAQIVKYLLKSGETIKGIDDRQKIIYCRAK